MANQRLDKTISGSTGLSRKDTQKAIRSGKVTVNGKAVYDPGARCDPQSDTITAFNSAVNYQKNVYIMMNKPDGILSAATDKKQKTVVDLLAEPLNKRNISPAGRLDKNTTGLIILSDDGDFIHRVISPSHHVKKQYIAVLDRLPDDDAAERFKSGITLCDGTICRPAGIEIISDEPPTVMVTLTEGIYHQVKRMLKTVSSGVEKLHRTQIGALTLDKNLKPGEYRELSKSEIDLIFNQL